MIYAIPRDSLISALETCAPICGKKHVNPAFARVRVALNHELRFTATDAVSTVCGARALSKPGIEQEGALDCAATLEAARRMPEGDVTLKLKADVLEMTAAKRTFKAVYLAADTLPPAPSKPSATFAQVPAKALAAAIGRVRWAMSDEGRKTDGMRLCLRGGSLVVQCMHNHHVAEASVAVESDASVDVIVPPGLVPSLVAAAGGAVSIGVLDDATALWVDSPTGLFRYLSSTELTIPPELVERVLPVAGPKVVTKRDELLEAVKYVALAAGHQAPKIRIEISAGGIALRGMDGQRETTDSIEGGGDPFTFIITPRHLIDALSNGGEEIELSQDGELQPVQLRSEGYRVCLMPLRPEMWG